jgi:hypothetical protein
MGLRLAVRRSYRYFIPAGLLDPRRTARRWAEPLFFYAIGLTTGMYIYAPATVSDRIGIFALVSTLALGALKGWSAAGRRGTPA